MASAVEAPVLDLEGKLHHFSSFASLQVFIIIVEAYPDHPVLGHQEALLVHHALVLDRVPVQDRAHEAAEAAVLLLLPEVPVISADSVEIQTSVPQHLESVQFRLI